MASLPPISAITRLIQIWPGRWRAASSLMRRPTSREPVKEMKRVLGCSTSTSPTVAPLPVSSVNAGLGEAGFQQNFGELGGDGGRLARRLDDGRVARHQRGHGHARQDGEREVPWRNHHAHAQRDVDHLVVLAGKLVDPLRAGQAQHFAGVVLAEIDAFGNVGFGFGPGLAGLRHQPGVELHLAGAQDAGGLQQQADALGGGRAAPLAGSTRARLPRRGWPARAWPCGGCPRLRADSRGSPRPAGRR